MRLWVLRRSSKAHLESEYLPWLQIPVPRLEAGQGRVGYSEQKQSEIHNTVHKMQRSDVDSLSTVSGVCRVTVELKGTSDDTKRNADGTM